MKKIIFFLIVLLSAMPSVKAECSDDDMIRLSKKANNVDISYMYNQTNNTFDITFSNITREINIEINNKVYDKDFELVLKNQKSGEYKINIYSNIGMCRKVLLLTKYESLPYYNDLYNSEECTGIENYTYCSKWLRENINESEKIKKIKKYKSSIIVEEEKKNDIKNTESFLDKIKKVIVDIYVNYYFIILPTIITILCVIIYIKDKNDSLF